MDEIRQRIDAQEYLRAELLSKDLIQLCLRGLRYFQTYDWLFLRSVITIGYVGWCIYCTEFLIRNHVLNQANIKTPNKMTTLVVIIPLFRFTLSAIPKLILYADRSTCYPCWFSFCWEPCCGFKRCLRFTMLILHSRSSSGTELSITRALSLSAYDSLLTLASPSLFSLVQLLSLFSKLW